LSNAFNELDAGYDVTSGKPNAAISMEILPYGGGKGNNLSQHQGRF
jgi:hypothetical protein